MNYLVWYMVVVLTTAGPAPAWVHKAESYAYPSQANCQAVAEVVAANPAVKSATCPVAVRGFPNATVHP